MNQVAIAFTSGGASAAITGLVAGFFGWRLRSANYATIVSEISRKVADDVRADNIGLKAEVRELDGKVDRLRDRVIVLIGLINRALPILEAAGEDVTEYREAVRNGSK